MVRWIKALALLTAVGLVPIACGDTATLVPRSPTTAPAVETTAEVQTTTTLAPATTLVTTTAATTTTEATTTTVTGPSAADDLASFFAAAESLDAEITAAAAIYNASFDAAAGTVGGAAIDAIGALSTHLLAGLIPPGLDIDLETAVLAVYADLESRIASLDGGVRYLNQGEYSDVEGTLLCLSFGSDSNARFGDDLAAAKALAESSPRPTAAADSEAAGVLAVRLETIRLMNWGCDSCGGVAVDDPIPVDWAGQTVIDGVEFEATFSGGMWEILIHAC
jgi:hypothetical protein